MVLYKIPSDTVLKHRKVFYDLWRRSDDHTKTWLNRVQNCIRRCKFPKLIEYLLIDKFMCELNRDEKTSIRLEANAWSLEQLIAYLDCQNIAVGRADKGDGKIDQNQMTSSSPMVPVKIEMVRCPF